VDTAAARSSLTSEKARSCKKTYSDELNNVANENENVYH
jgi:hypothetical protein